MSVDIQRIIVPLYKVSNLVPHLFSVALLHLMEPSKSDYGNGIRGFVAALDTWAVVRQRQLASDWQSRCVFINKCHLDATHSFAQQGLCSELVK